MALLFLCVKMYVMEDERIGQKLRDLRKRRKLSQEAMGTAIGIDRSVISRWETGAAIPTIEQLKDLAAFFDVPVMFFLGTEEEGTGSPSERNLEKNRKNHNTQIVILAVGIIGILLSPFSILPALFLMIYSIYRKMPWYMILFTVFVVVNCFDDILFILGYDLFPTIYSVH